VSRDNHIVRVSADSRPFPFAFLILHFALI